MGVPQQRMGRCLCNNVPPTLKPSIKKLPVGDASVDLQQKRQKQQQQQQLQQQHLVPQVQVFVPCAAQQQQQQQQLLLLQHASNEEVEVVPKMNRSEMLTSGRKNWNNTIDVVSHANCSQQHRDVPLYKLRRYGSQQSCRSATTLPSMTNTGRATGHRSHYGRVSESHSDELADDLEDEKIPGGPGINERELWSLHRAVPGLRHHDPRTTTIRQHYYPEGGWGWLVVGAAFLVQVLTTGLQLAFGVMAAQIVHNIHGANVMEAVWIGVIQLSGSWMSAPLVVALCRRKSTRLAAVLGGLVLALATLFASFAVQLHQVFLSYGALMSIAIALVRESSALMVGQYFKRRRDFVEIIVQIGSGIGVSLFAVFFKETLGQLGWRLGLQAATGLLLSTFFLGTFYRSASLYHPQRRAILHLKTQRKKVKVKGKPSNDRPPYFDFSVLRLKSLRMILLSSGIGAIGAYTPLFYLALHGEADGLESSDLLLIHTFLGLAMTCGTVIVGLIVVRPSSQCIISLQYLCQVTLYGIGISLLALASISGYHGYVLFAWFYGFCLGGYQYALHQYTLDRVRARQFARGWTFVLAVRALPTLFGVPIAGYINQNTPRAGYYFSFTFTVIGASLLFLAKMYRRSAPASLFLGSAAVCSPSFQCSTSESHSQRSGAAAPAATCDKECHQEKSSQEPLFRAESSNGHPIQVIRTVHQDVCTCITQHQPLDRLNSRQKLLRNLRQTITLKLDGLQHAWRKNRLSEFLSRENGSISAAPIPTTEMMSCFSQNALDKATANYPYEIEWEEYWNGCLGSCNHIDVDCDGCNSCIDCDLPLEEQNYGGKHHCHMHPPMLPDAIDIPELPPQIKHGRLGRFRTIREMSFSDPEHIQKVGMSERYVHYPDIPQLPPKVLRRQHTWHDVRQLTRDVDLIEQMTTSV